MMYRLIKGLFLVLLGDPLQVPTLQLSRTKTFLETLLSLKKPFPDFYAISIPFSPHPQNTW